MCASTGTRLQLPVAESAPARPRLGLIVNPIAGLGGRVGLKGTDGPDTVADALARGAVPQAQALAVAALRAFSSAWPAGRPLPALLSAPGLMGVGAILAEGLEAQTIGAPIVAPTTGDDTRRLAASLEAAGIDMLLFVGGDGTARDVQAAVGASPVVLGVPAGVKIQSGVFGTSATAAGEAAARFLSRTDAPTLQGEVLDLDEEAYRRGEVAPRLFGYLRVPQGRRVQGRKTPSPAPELLAMQAIAADILEGLEPDVLYILGPGTTVRSVAERLGVPKTLVGVDAMRLEGDTVRLVAADLGERELLALVGSTRARIVLTPIGGQGFLLGRGNRPISPAVIHTVGRAGMLIVATSAKLASLGGRSLLVDTGDPVLDAELSGHVSVITGYRERAIVALAAG